MKIKTDFVTNSSSTSYFFIFKGKDENDLFKIMKNHWDRFEYQSCYDNNKIINVYEIIEYMKSEGYLKVVSITDSIEETKKRIKELNKSLKDKTLNTNYCYKYIQINEKILELLKYKKSKGFKLVASAGFCDGDANEVGATMRYSNMNDDIDHLKIFKYDDD